jgi:hypothetical protein
VISCIDKAAGVQRKTVGVITLTTHRTAGVGKVKYAIVRREREVERSMRKCTVVVEMILFFGM